jgi:hypothetical protein
MGKKEIKVCVLKQGDNVEEMLREGFKANPVYSGSEDYLRGEIMT